LQALSEKESHPIFPFLKNIIIITDTQDKSHNSAATPAAAAPPNHPQ
jgi:hypothetical protein